MQWSNYDVVWQIKAATCEGSGVTSDVTGLCVVPPLSDREQLESALIAIAVIIPLAILVIIFLIIIGIVRRKR